MKRIIILLALIGFFGFGSTEVYAQKKKAPKAKTDPTLRPSKSQKKVKKKIVKRKKKSSFMVKPNHFARAWRREQEWVI